MGTAFIIAAACVVNNYLDRGIDAKMARTKQRAIAAGRVSAAEALIYAATLLTCGTAMLWLKVNALTALVGLSGFLAYTLLYSLAKRRSHHGTLVGTISGATPPVAGYTAVTNQLDSAAVLLFVLLVAWQMPHFYAIALYRQKQYKAAGIPVLPLVKGTRRTRVEMIIYVVIFLCAGLLLTVLGHTGYLFAGLVAGVGATWLAKATRASALSDEAWGKQMFLFSLKALLIVCVGLGANAWLP